MGCSVFVVHEQQGAYALLLLPVLDKSALLKVQKS